jgi:hypothetical protein
MVGHRLRVNRRRRVVTRKKEGERIFLPLDRCLW